MDSDHVCEENDSDSPLRRNAIPLCTSFTRIREYRINEQSCNRENKFKCIREYCHLSIPTMARDKVEPIFLKMKFVAIFAFVLSIGRFWGEW